MKNDRRKFIKNIGGSMALVALGSQSNAANKTSQNIESKIKVASNDAIKIGLIGSGIIGHFDTDTALRVPGVELVAVCDLYTGRLDRAKEKWGSHIFTTRDYRALLAKKEIDAVLICTPDHWHQKIAIDAMNAGKHVYCEKPMVQKIEQGWDLINTQKQTQKVFQVGSQMASAAGILEAKKVYAAGGIGEITLVEAYCDRSDARGAWNYSIPTDASPDTIDFDTFLGNAPKVAFDAKRFFRWRNYGAYGTGAAGDLIVHLLTGIHTITDAHGPNKIMSFADLKLWKDGRDSFDIINAIMDYKASPRHNSFHVSTKVNLTDGEGKGGFGLKIIGTEGVIEGNGTGFKLRSLKRRSAPGYGGYDSFDSFSEKQKQDFKKWYQSEYGNDTDGGYDLNKETVFNTPDGYDDRLDHMIVFFNAVRTGSKIIEDASFGLRAAAPSISCNLSAQLQKPILWDPEAMKIIG